MNANLDKSMNTAIERIVKILSELRSAKSESTESLNQKSFPANALLEEVYNLAVSLRPTERDRQHEYILDGAGLGSWDWWLDTNDVSFDRRWCGMLGLKPEETAQNFATWDSRVHPDEKEKTYRDIKRYLAGETTVYENIHRMIHADGHWVWILSRGRISEYDTTGKPVRFTGTHLDVTDFMEQQRLSEEIQKIANIGGWELDAATGQTRWTPETYRIHGVPEGTPTNTIMGINFYATRDQPRITRYVQECLQGKPYRDVFEIIDAQNRKKWVEVMGKPVFDSAGRVYKVAGTFQDISEKIEKNEEYRFILEALGIGLWKFNPISQELFWDKGMYDLYEVSAVDTSSHLKDWENSLSGESKIRMERELQLALSGEKEFITSFEIATKSQERKYIAARGKVYRDEHGAPTMMYGINYDRTKEEKIASELEFEKLKSIRNAKLATLGEMSAGIAHEINTHWLSSTEPSEFLPKSQAMKNNLRKKLKRLTRQPSESQRSSSLSGNFQELQTSLLIKFIYCLIL